MHRKKAQTQAHRRQLALAESTFDFWDVAFTNKTANDLLKRIKSGDEDKISDREWDKIREIPELLEMFAEAEERRRVRLEEIDEISEEMTFTQKYLWNMTPEEIYRNRRRLARKEKLEELRNFARAYPERVRSELVDDMRDTPWWRYSETPREQQNRRRQAIRRARSWKAKEDKLWEEHDWTEWE